VAGLFAEGAVRPVADGETTARIEVASAGDLRLSSGRLVAADPGWLSTDQPSYVVTVAPGSYPVSISRAHLAGDEEHVRVAGERERYAALFDGDLPDELELTQGGFAMLDGGRLLAYHSGWGDGS